MATPPTDPAPSPAPESLILRPLRADDEQALRRMHAQLAAEHFEVLFDAERPFAEILETARREAVGEDLPPGRVAADFLVAEVEGTVVGRVSIRHELTGFLHAVGGHVGYAVAPEHRRKGYAMQMLRESVHRLWELGVDRVLVTCDDDNAASAATIERCGGVLEDVRELGGGAAKRRYWIDAGAESSDA